MMTDPEVKKFEKSLELHPDWPRAICLGDSWFQYPPGFTDLHVQLRGLFKRSLFWNDSMAGRESAQIKGILPRVRSVMSQYQFQVLLLSMGGNDVVGTELAEFVKTEDEPQSYGSTAWGTVPPEVRDHIRLSAFEHALAYMLNDFRQVIALRDQVAPNCEIVAHTYAYPWPDGTPFKLLGIKAGPWLKPYFDGVGLTDPAGQRTVAVWLIDQFERALRDLVSQTRRMRCVDSRKLLPNRSQWENEIHPTKAGFRRLATMAWRPALNGLLK